MNSLEDSIKTNNFGKYGLINLSDIVIHKIEFDHWLLDVKNKTINELNKQNEQIYFEEFIDAFNNSKFPNKKYYDFIKHSKKKLYEHLKKRHQFRGLYRNQQYFLSESKFIFDDEGKKEKEKKLQKEMEQKRKLDKAIYTMNKEKAEAMRELELKENLMRYYYQTSNINAALNLHKEVFGEKDDIYKNHNKIINNLNMDNIRYDSDLNE